MSKKKYPKMEFTISQLPNCCGIGVIGGFEERTPRRDWCTGKIISNQMPFKSVEEQAEDCYKRIIKATWGHGAADSYSQLLISLVSSFSNKDYASRKENTAQYTELEAILLREEWTIYSVFINPNHGNEVTLYGKYFPERDYDPYE